MKAGGLAAASIFFIYLIVRASLAGEVPWIISLNPSEVLQGGLQVPTSIGGSV